MWVTRVRDLALGAEPRDRNVILLTLPFLSPSLTSAASCPQSIARILPKFLPCKCGPDPHFHDVRDSSLDYYALVMSLHTSGAPCWNARKLPACSSNLKLQGETKMQAAHGPLLHRHVLSTRWHRHSRVAGKSVAHPAQAAKTLTILLSPAPNAGKLSG